MPQEVAQRPKPTVQDLKAAVSSVYDLTIEDVSDIMGCHRTTIFARIRTDPSFPRPRKRFGRLYWSSLELDAYLKALNTPETEDQGADTHGD